MSRITNSAVETVTLRGVNGQGALALDWGTVNVGTVMGGTTEMGTAPYVTPWRRLDGTAGGNIAIRGTAVIHFPPEDGAFSIVENVSPNTIMNCRAATLTGIEVQPGRIALMGMTPDPNTSESDMVLIAHNNPWVKDWGTVNTGTVNSGTVTLTDNQYRWERIRVGGTATGTVLLIFPGTEGASWQISNQGSAIIVPRVASGTAQIPSLSRAVVGVDNGEIGIFARFP